MGGAGTATRRNGESGSWPPFAGSTDDVVISVCVTKEDSVNAPRVHARDRTSVLIVISDVLQPTELHEQVAVVTVQRPQPCTEAIRKRRSRLALIVSCTSNPLARALAERRYGLLSRAPMRLGAASSPPFTARVHGGVRLNWEYGVDAPTWTRTDSNRQPSACKAVALPLELQAHGGGHSSSSGSRLLEMPPVVTFRFGG